MKRVLLLLGALVLFVAAIVGLLLTDGGPRSRPAGVSTKGAEPADHIDESSREALREILREEGGG